MIFDTKSGARSSVVSRFRITSASVVTYKTGHDAPTVDCSGDVAATLSSSIWLGVESSPGSRPITQSGFAAVTKT